MYVAETAIISYRNRETEMFQVGDKVKIVDSDLKGVIVALPETGNYLYLVDTGNVDCCYYHFEMELDNV